jgi:3'(2'), 5'-bisphosphate nucleotidase
MRAEADCGALLPRVLALVREAGRAVMDVYGSREHGLQLKADDSPVTHADLASHRILADGLGKLTPSWPILSEEGVPVPFCERQLWRNFWLIDPLDGTREFLRRSGEFTVNVALIMEAAPALGVVYAPAFDKLYYAVRKSGSFRMEEEIAKPIRVAAAKKNGETRLVISRGHASAQDRNYAGNSVLQMGSSLKFCLLAEGAADVYPRNGTTMEWDTAAGQCILEEAGGWVLDLVGEPLRYNKADLRNPAFLACTHTHFR